MWRGERRTRILIVDDESGFRESLARRLEKRGAVIKQAGNGAEAVEAQQLAHVGGLKAARVCQIERQKRQHHDAGAVHE